jgi:hypothetical protein
MAQVKALRSSFGRAVGVGAMALAAAALTTPTVSMAQDRGQRGSEGGGGRSWEGRSGGGPQNQVDRGRGMQQRPPQAAPQQQTARQAPATVQQAPVARGDRAQRYQGQNGQAYRGRDGQLYPGQGGRNVRMQDQRNWTDAQRQAYRGAVLEGRATDQFQNRGNDRGTTRNDRPGDRDGRGQAQWQGGRDNGWQGNRSGWQNDRRGSDGREAWRNNGSRDNRSWDRGWRRNSRYNWSSYRSSNRNVFSGGRYYSPYQNYSYRRVGIGFSLGSLFYGSQYLINDPYYYRLPEAYGPYRWVRYYDDVLLVDTYTGEVVDAIYDFFY